MRKGFLNERTKLLWCTLLPAMLFGVMLARPQTGFSQIEGIKRYTKGTSGPINCHLLELQKAYGDYVQTGNAKSYDICKKFFRIRDNRVVIDAIASGDASALLADLKALGLQNGAMCSAPHLLDTKLTVLNEL